MRKIALAAVLVAGVVVVPAQAKPAKSHKCTPHSVAYTGHGTYVSGTLTQTAGAGTTTTSDDRYSGDVVVNLSRASHHAPKGQQTLTLDNARVRFGGGRTLATLAAGDRVEVTGKVTTLAKKCDTTGFTATITVRRLDVKPAKAPKS